MCPELRWFVFHGRQFKEAELQRWNVSISKEI
jgi:hypothetical protein